MDYAHIPTKIFEIISNSDFCISYHPIAKEIDPISLPIKLPKKNIIVPIDRSVDPNLFGKRINDRFKRSRGFILVPGSKFDRFGGRYGRGGGWFDRLLSEIPIELFRIGICKSNEFSEAKLKLKDWDQHMDLVIVKDDSGFRFYDTNAR